VTFLLFAFKILLFRLKKTATYFLKARYSIFLLKVPLRLNQSVNRVLATSVTCDVDNQTDFNPP